MVGTMVTNDIYVQTSTLGCRCGFMKLIVVFYSSDLRVITHFSINILKNGCSSQSQVGGLEMSDSG
jgi:hypothetical protein